VKILSKAKYLAMREPPTGTSVVRTYTWPK
jgi:hypothetical protein